MTDGGLRPARPGDADAIAGLQLASWRAGYAPLFPPGVLAGIPIDGVRASWQEAIARPPSPRHRLLVALAGDTPVGFAASMPAGDPDTDPATAGELSALVIDPTSSRLGHGNRLLAATVACWRADGATHGFAWLLGADSAMYAFLTAAGWAPDGAHRDLAISTDAVAAEIRLHTDLRD